MMQLTIGSCIQDNEACIDESFILPMLEFHSIRMSSQPVGGLVQIDIVMRPVQRPQGTYSSATTADDGDFLSRNLRC